ncbi:hypothetical protein K9N50_04480 [bacterium]|nr:hypothetical protein [bacterium]
MTKNVTNVIELVKKLDGDERQELINQLVKNDLLNDIVEDVEDLLLYISRRDEPAEDFMEFIEELRREGRQV